MQKGAQSEGQGGRYGPLVGSLILSPLWVFWHVPIWLTVWRAAGMFDVYNLIVYILFITVWTNFGMVIGLGAVALVVIGLTRGQLGYQTHRREEDLEEDLEASPA